MPKKVILSFTLLVLTACLVSYKLGSAPVAYAQTLPPSPGTWALTNANGGVSGWVSVTEPAISGVQHVATCITGSMFNSGTTYTNANVYLLNGNAGGSAVILHWELLAPANAYSSVNLCNLNVVGTVDTPMTLEISDGTGIYVDINLVGYDAQ